MKDQVKLIRGIANRDGKPIITAEDFLDASCKCGINCCYGYLKLPNYNSLSGDSTTGALYIVDGEVVISTVEEAEIAITALRNTVPVVLPTTPITNGLFTYDVGNSDTPFTYKSSPANRNGTNIEFNR